ncbi:MAG: hypothetical protein Q4C42_01255 [Clostridia bacterium]|nr:hypothetical protein [Clostridia bacterium]
MKDIFRKNFQSPFAGADYKRPEAADYLRIIAVFTVAWYHIWQQSWVSAGKMDFWVRTGYLWVDALIMLSAFCLFLPYANEWVENGDIKDIRLGDTLRFYKKRAIRLIPGYYLSIMVPFIITLIEKGMSKNLRLICLHT